jgi:hypothetical protein
MDVNQFRPVGSGVGGAGANTMIFDNWRLAASGLQQPVGAQIATNIGGFNYCFQVYPNPAVALASGDSVIIYTPVEGYRIARLAWGNAGAVPITIAFWVYSAYPGLYSGSVINGANNSRSYIFTYTINSANTWEYKTITIPGDTAGSWPTDNSRALQVNFQIAIAAGNAAIGAANFWATGSYTAVAGTTNALASGGNFFLTGFAIFPGNAAPTAAQLPFVMRTYDQEFLLCQRYFQFWSGLLGCGYNGTGTGLFWDYTFPQMRAVPGITVANAAYSNSATISLNAGYSNHFRVQVNVITGGFAYWYGDYSLNASL